MFSECISKFTRSRPPSVCLNTLDYGLQVHLLTPSITVSKCISKLARLQPPSSHDHGLQVHLQTGSITAWEYIFKVCRPVSGNIGVTEVDRVTGSIYSADPRVDTHHTISISSYHAMKIHTLSCPTFGLTRSVRDVVDSCNWVDPQHRVVSYPLTWFVCSSKQNHLSSWIPFGCCERCSIVLMVGFLPSSSIVSPQRPPSGASLSFLNGRIPVLRLCSTTICGQIDHMYIYTET